MNSNDTLTIPNLNAAKAALETNTPLARTRGSDSTREVLQRHLKCFAEGDLEGVLSDYAPGAIMFTAEKLLKGADAMRPLFQALIAEFGEPGAVFTMKAQFIEGEYGYILWAGETADKVYEMATDTFVVRDGKIVAQSFTGKIATKP